jgi:hypothetical protein
LLLNFYSKKNERKNLSNAATNSLLNLNRSENKRKPLIWYYMNIKTNSIMELLPPKE